MNLSTDGEPGAAVTAQFESRLVWRALTREWKATLLMTTTLASISALSLQVPHHGSRGAAKIAEVNALSFHSKSHGNHREFVAAMMLAATTDTLNGSDL